MSKKKKAKKFAKFVWKILKKKALEKYEKC